LPPDSKVSLFDRVQDKAAEMIVSAMQFVGVRYARGGDSAETGFDCSGFTRHVFQSALGLVLPRRADEQAQAPGFASVPREALQPGDLVFFNTLRREFSHVGIYIGENRFIHAPSRGKDVRTDDLRQTYWADRFNGARRASLFSALLPSGD
jgi:cell wall-associated NlpC family hydrolase